MKGSYVKKLAQRKRGEMEVGRDDLEGMRRLGD